MAGLLTSSMAMSIFETDAPGYLDLERLRKGAFTDAMDPDGVKSGWVGLGNPLDTDNFILAGNDSRFSGFSFRMDIRKPSAAVIRLQVAEKIRQEEAEGKKTGSKRKKEIREEVTQRLTESAEFVPSLTDCLWDAKTGVLMIGSTSEKMVDRILKHFEACFGKTPAPLASEEDMGTIFSKIQRDNGLPLSAFKLQPMGSASLKSMEINSEISAINVTNNPEAVNEALDKGYQIKKISLVATENANEENQIYFSMDDLLQINNLRFQKPDREDGEDATFLINARVCADTAQMLAEMAQLQQQ